MPVIDLGSVVGPQGPQGPAGATGAQGAQGPVGPNQVTAGTSTTLSGLLYGNGSTVSTKVFGDNYTVYATESNIRVTFSSISGSGSSVTKTASSGLITANHEVVHVALGNPAAQVGDWSWATAAGSLSISGEVNGSTTMVVILVKRGTSVTAS